MCFLKSKEQVVTGTGRCLCDWSFVKQDAGGLSEDNSDIVRVPFKETIIPGGSGNKWWIQNNLVYNTLESLTIVYSRDLLTRYIFLGPHAPAIYPAI